jgi:hypothetical protein
MSERSKKSKKLKKALLAYYESLKEKDCYPVLPTPEDLGIRDCSKTGCLSFEELLKYVEL